VAVASALLLSVNALHILFSQVARSYGLLLSLVTLSSLLFIRGLERPSWRWWAAYGLATTCAVYTHLFTIFVVGAQWISLAFLRYRRIPWSGVLPAIASTAALTLPLGLSIVLHNVEQSWGIPRPGLDSLRRLSTTLAGGRWFLLLLYATACAVALAGAAGVPLSDRCRAATPGRGPVSNTKRDAWSVAFLLTWAVAPIGLAFAVSMVKPIWASYYFIICLPPIVILVARGASLLRPAAFGTAVLTCVVAIALFEDVHHVQHTGEDWRGAAAAVASTSLATDAIVFYKPFIRTSFEFYRDELGAARLSSPQVVFPLEDTLTGRDPGKRPSEALLQALPAQYSRVWLVTGYDWGSGLEREDAASRSIQASLAKMYPFQRVGKFSGDIVVRAFARHPLSAWTAPAPSAVMPSCP